MQTTTYFVTYPAGSIDADTAALVHLINDSCCGSGDNRSWDALHARLDALIDASTQHRFGIGIDTEDCEASEDC